MSGATNQEPNRRRVVAWSTAGAVLLAIGVLGALWLRISPASVAARETGPRPVLGLAIERVADGAALRFDLSGVEPGTVYTVRMHAGSCDQPSASAGRLGQIVTGADGRGTLRAVSTTVGTGGAAVPLTMDLLTDGERVVDVLAPDGTRTVCAALPR
jgi:hypothetical protein